MDSCIFCRIVRGEIPSEKVYEDPRVYAFHDIHPAAPVHFMLIPKLHLNSLAEVEDAHSALLGEMMVLVPRLAREQGCTDGFRTIINTGRVGGQEVNHLHIHIIGGMERLPGMIARGK
ncbi:histidine triad nucleotide-binding protein [Nitrosospira multiformis]|jgi:histidine triad (HIT) family protein|uniref:Histidine triad (HIT) family protein n=1 Tax=Nitrosospira multiformis TaxID=1231 RepID=A0A1I7G6C0_9PROT|nr:histidine triad nucleotide-binding protein [Nitrosospira multiformis]SFU44025.1 histidine triad (HIT) family protein [Nitrosospira multiformis]